MASRTTVRRSLAETYRVERGKWDGIARREGVGSSLALSYAGFEEYARRSSNLTGVADFLGDLRGKNVLEYGCGLGTMATLLARSGAHVSAFDLSPASIEVAARRADVHGVDVALTVAAGEALPYADESFDVVVGKAVLHHVDAEPGARELHRVLRPGGRAAFAEPMGTNPLLGFVREHVPYRAKTPRGADRPLTYADIRAWGQPFGEVRFREVQLLAMLQRAFGFRRRFETLHRLDDALLAAAPALRRFCRYVVLYLVK